MEEDKKKKICWHALDADTTAELLKSDVEKGISTEASEERRRHYGLNKIKEAEKRNLLLLFISQFKSSVVYLLLGAAVLSAYFGEWADALAILAVLLINAGIGFYMEMQAQKSMDALRKLAAVPARVIRGGKTIQIDSMCIVPGDLLFVEAGDMITADARIVRAIQLQVNESSLTGESAPIEKIVSPLPENATLPERHNMLYKGTFITKGNAYALVTATGMKTELGKVAKLVERSEQSATPLEQKLARFSKRLIYVTIGLVLIVFIAGLLHGHRLIEMIQTCIALSVAAIPEGLPIVATLALANGMIRMARKKVIIRKLSAVETLGGTDIICTDKTGTLTENKITVSVVVSADAEWDEHRSAIPDKESFKIMQRIAVLCNTAELQNEQEEGSGDPVETGLLKFAFKTGSDVSALRERYPMTDQEPFTSETKMMASVHINDGKKTVYYKGAAEVIISQSDRIYDGSMRPMEQKDKDLWLEKANEISASGMKVIAGAFNPDAGESITEQLVFIGLFGMIDPPAEGVKEALEECKSAGVHVIMITGDHPATAKNIAMRLGITDGKDEVLLGKNMNKYSALTDTEKNEWANTHVFARVTPEQKLDLVKVLQEKNHIVGMTGDGVNDAPALKKSDIGIAMGKRGTQVAQQASDIVLQDDSFRSIVTAIREGRVIFENIYRFIIYLLSSNMSELFVIAAVAVFDLPFQLLPLQILFINIITDVFPALALGVTEGSVGIMKRPPRVTGAEIIGKREWLNIILYSLILALAAVSTVLARHFYFSPYAAPWDEQKANNILFFTLVSAQLIHVFNMYKTGTPFFKSEVIRNKYVWYALLLSFSILVTAYLVLPLRKLLGLELVTLTDVLLVGCGALAAFLLNQIFRKVGVIVH